MKLHKLSNGDWVDLKTVTAIRPLPASSERYGGTHRSRVIVHHGSGQIAMCVCNDDLHAQSVADELAELTNA